MLMRRETFLEAVLVGVRGEERAAKTLQFAQYNRIKNFADHGLNTDKSGFLDGGC